MTIKEKLWAANHAKAPAVSLASALQSAITAKAERPPAATRRIGETVVNGLTFSATFDSGNLARVQPDGTDAFIVWARADCEGMAHARKTRTWFCFSVRGAAPGRALHIEVRMSDQSKLYSHDMRPVYRSLPSQPAWQRLREPSPRNDAPSSEGFGIHLRHTVAPSSAGETLYFAFCFPHSYADCMAQLAWLDALTRQPKARLSPEDQSSYWKQTSEVLASAASAAAPSAAPAAESADAHTAVTPDQMAAFRRTRLVDAAWRAAAEASVPPSATRAVPGCCAGLHWWQVEWPNLFEAQEA